MSRKFTSSCRCVAADRAKAHRSQDHNERRILLNACMQTDPYWATGVTDSKLVTGDGTFKGDQFIFILVEVFVWMQLLNAQFQQNDRSTRTSMQTLLLSFLRNSCDPLLDCSFTRIRTACQSVQCMVVCKSSISE
ncbi:hypothetical protein Tcan_09846 [Toxocara canis]|uniref:Uncharacterized protein n=1 Tax=Toxocara canis TaxID=6265 RepID=A0A0B2VB80_TOXCA|nr:hypothetical protein Tcan_09846 [Toxocara canis]